MTEDPTDIPPTQLQQRSWDAYQRHGGDAVRGAASKAAIELGTVHGNLKAALDGYRRHHGLPVRGAAGRPKPPTARSVVRGIPDRLTEIEGRLSLIDDTLAALTQAADVLASEIQAWTNRQPIYVEMRERHDRVADGGDGGRRERKRLRALPAGPAS